MDGLPPTDAVGRLVLPVSTSSCINRRHAGTSSRITDIVACPAGGPNIKAVLLQENHFVIQTESVAKLINALVLIINDKPEHKVYLGSIPVVIILFLLRRKDGTESFPKEEV